MTDDEGVSLTSTERSLKEADFSSTPPLGPRRRERQEKARSDG
jgi:hypothetical protein